MSFTALAKKTFIGFILMATLGCTQDQPIQIGMVAGLTGRMSQLGISARNAVLLAITEINDQGGIRGRKLELIVRDNQGDPKLCGQVIQELADQNVAGIIGPLMSKMAQTVLETIEKNPVLIISPTISTDAIKNLDDFFFRLMPGASLEAETMAKVVHNDGHNSAAVVFDSSNRAYTEPIYRTFKQKFEADNGTIVYVNDMSGAEKKNFSHIAQEIIGSDAQALYIISSGIDASFLTQQIRKRTSDILFYGAYWVKTGKIIEQGGRSVEGMTIAAPFELETKSKAYKAFSAHHNKMFNTDPDFVAAYAYEATWVLLHGIRQSPDLSAINIKKAILNQKTFQGLEQPFDINPYGDTIRSMMLMTIKEGQFQRRS